mgnify:CR=1 FL=1
MSGNHARVAGMELACEAVSRERLVQRVDTIGDVQRRSFVPFGQEIAHRPIHRPGQADRDAFASPRARTIHRWRGRPTTLRSTRGAALPLIHVEQPVQTWVEQIDDATDRLKHVRKLSETPLSHWGRSTPLVWKHLRHALQEFEDHT